MSKKYMGLILGPSHSLDTCVLPHVVILSRIIISKERSILVVDDDDYVVVDDNDDVSLKLIGTSYYRY